MKLRVIFTFVALVISLSFLVGCGGGGGGSSYAPVDDSVPTVVSKTTPEDISQTDAQVKLAVNEAIATVDLPISLRADVRGSEVPTFVPGFGDNTLINPSKMMNLLTAAIPTGGNVSGGFGMEDDVKQQLATYTASTKTLIVTNIASPTYAKNVTTITGVEAVVTNNILLSATIGTDAILEVKNYSQTGVLESTTEFKIISGLTVDTDYTIQDFNPPVFISNRVYPDGGEGGWNAYKLGTETTQITFASPFEVNVKLTEGGKTSTGSLKFTDMTGKYTLTNSFLHGKGAWKTVGGVLTERSEEELYKRYYGDSKATNELAFAGNQLKLDIKANWANEGLIVDSFALTLPMQTTTTNFDHGMNYKVVGATGEMQVRYTGTESEKYGYIKSLVATLSSVNFDPTKDMVDDGALVSIKKTDTSDAVTTLEYKIVNGQPVLQSGKGNEVITVDANENVVAKGNVQYTKAGETNALTIAYERTKSKSGEITARVEVTFGTFMMTMFFTLEEDKSIAQGNGKIFEGHITTPGSVTKATFTRTSAGAVTVTLTN